MKIYNEHITLQTAKPRDIVNITTQVKAALEKELFARASSSSHPWTRTPPSS